VVSFGVVPVVPVPVQETTPLLPVVVLVVLASTTTNQYRGTELVPRVHLPPVLPVVLLALERERMY
jgi:hypothetical protein